MKENKRMNLLTMEHITKAYTDRVLLNDVAFSINENEKIGVIGINGMGKSTLLKVTAGIEPYDEGKISMGKQVKICYLPQTPEFEEGTTVLRAAIADNVNELNQWTIEADARSMLNQLGFYDYDEKVEHMSGGQKKRIALVNALLTPADILIRLAAEAMGTKKVVIRTADLGGEKQAECLELGEDRNPEIGYRGIRVSLDKDEIFKTQLRAILRASAYGNMSVMFPMITDVEEVKQAKLILEKIKNELKDEKIPFNEEIKIGVMIETPAAVMISGELAREADFFSIGTNDLTQLTLGMDRTNSRLERFYNTHHPALLKMIRIIANNIHLEGKKIALCGDLAADLSLTEKFIQMGIDELSVAPNQVLALRKKIREIQ